MEMGKESEKIDNKNREDEKEENGKVPGKERKDFSPGETARIYLRILKLIWRHFPNNLVSVAMSKLFKAALPYITLYFSARFLDELAGARRPEILTRWVVLVLVVSAAASLLERILFRWERAEIYNFHWNHQAELFGKKLLETEFAKMDDPDTVDRLTQIEQNNMFMGHGINMFMGHIDKLLEGIFLIFGGMLLSWSLFTRPVAEPYAGSVGWKAAQAGILLAVLITILLRPLFHKREREDTLAYSSHGTAANRKFFWYGMRFYDKTENAADVRIYRQDVFDSEELADCNRNLLGNAEIMFRRVIGKCRAGSAMFSHLTMGGIYLYVCLKAWFGAFGVGSVTRYVGALNSMANGAASVLNLFAEARTNAYYLNKICEFLDISNEMYQGSLTVEKRNDRNYEVEFRDVSFRYPNTREYALRHVNMRFRVGERLAVVGENGSGKTTFIKLLCRLYDPTEGQILLNGIDIRKYDYQEYLSVFSVVFQDFQLLSLGLGQNVAAGTVYDTGRVRDCLGKAGLADWLAKQPEGLETKLYKEIAVGEGVEVSGGEEQKIAIARSMYRDAPFVILDEPTAALDPVSEYEVYSHFNDIIADCTAIYISHRLSSCRFCDEIAVFHQGSIIEKGTHEQLLGQGGKYCELWTAQAQYYI